MVLRNFCNRFQHCNFIDQQVLAIQIQFDSILKTDNIVGIALLCELVFYNLGSRVNGINWVVENPRTGVKRLIRTISSNQVSFNYLMLMLLSFTNIVPAFLLVIFISFLVIGRLCKLCKDQGGHRISHHLIKNICQCRNAALVENLKWGGQRRNLSAPKGCNLNRGTVYINKIRGFGKRSEFVKPICAVIKH